MIKNMSIKGKLALGFLFIVFLPMMVLGFVLFQDVKSKMLRSSENHMLSILRSLNREIAAFNEHNIDYLTFVSAMPDMTRVAGNIIRGERQEETQRQLYAIFSKAIASNSEIEGIFLLHPESGEVLSSSLPYHEGMFFNKRPYFEPGKKQPVLYPVHYSHPLEKNIMAIAAPVRDEHALLGVLVAWIKLTELKNITRIDPGINTYLVTHSNIHIIGADQDGADTPFRSGIFTEGVTNALEGKTGSGIYRDDSGREVVGAYTLIEPLDLALLAEKPMADVLRNANAKGVRFLIITLGLALFVFLAALMIGNHITHPIINLTRSIRRYAEAGASGAIPTPGSGREVTELGAAFNKMIARRADDDEALKKSGARLAEAQHIAHIGSWEYDAGKNSLWWSEELYSIFGWDPQKVTLSIPSFLNAVHPDDRKQLENEMHSGEPYRTDYRIVRPDGDIRFIHEEVRMQKGADGRSFMVWGTAQDITELKKAEEALREREQHLQTIINVEPECVKMLSSDGTLLHMNPSGLSMIEADSLDQVKGKCVYPLISAEHRDAFRELTERVCCGGEGSLEFRMVGLKGAHRWLDTHAVPFRNANNDIIGLLAVTRDITDRKRTEEHLESLNRDLMQKNREMEQILYVTSHDLRSPLVNIDGFSKELEFSLNELSEIIRQCGVSQDVRAKIASIVQKDIPESMHYIRSSTKKMDLLLSGLLRLSRVGRTELKRVPLDMNRIMSDIINTFEFQLQQAGVKIEVLELPPCIGDEEYINRAFSNLIDNAIKYLDHERPGSIRISGYPGEEKSVYCVEDNGIGIAPDYQAKVFEIFHRLDPEKHTGEGLGLTITNKIIEMHSGSVWVESETGAGSRFFVSLPA
jgi:PAS domain S-box-containing protein